ncbi:MAG: hypothetical protein M1826_001209 [Phylliscum demangeonii]|nr:MAG: hypothetical protein M1826_001209 [Phylliscum demangeonii]
MASARDKYDDEEPPLFRWLLDVRQLWKEDFEAESRPLLSLLTPAERAAVLGYHQSKDRRMSLGSMLLKYHAVAQCTGLPWSSIVLSAAPGNGKPCYRPPPSSSSSSPYAGHPTGVLNHNGTIEFNVSHQAGLVALIACRGQPTTAAKEVGIDIACVDERGDELARIDDEGGFVAWLAMFRDIFSARELDDVAYCLPPDTVLVHVDSHAVLPALEPAELARLARCCNRPNQLMQARVATPSAPPTPLPPSPSSIPVNSSVIIDAKLRRFYTFWALKEAYVKFVGEALLADWLRELEFRSVRAPRPAPAPTISTSIATAAADDTTLNPDPGLGSSSGPGASSRWGHVVRDIEVWRARQRVRDVAMEVQAFEGAYLIASAVAVPDNDNDNDTDDETRVLFPAIQILDIHADILPFVAGRPATSLEQSR